MKRQIAFAVLLMGVFLGSVASADEAWKEFPSTDGKWTVKFPGTPTDHSQPVETAAGTLQERLWMVALPSGTAYAAGYVEYPAGIGKDKNEAMLDGARDGMIGKVNGKLNSETKITLNGSFPGREANVTVPGGITLVVRTYLVNQRLYQLMIISAAPTDTAPFFGSFKVSKP